MKMAQIEDLRQKEVVMGKLTKKQKRQTKYHGNDYKNSRFIDTRTNNIDSDSFTFDTRKI